MSKHTTVTVPPGPPHSVPPGRDRHLVNADYLQIYPPNQTTPVYLKYKAAACAKPVQVITASVVKPGSGSS